VADRATERQFETDARELLDALRVATAALAEASIDALTIGGIAVAALSRPRWTHDIDLLVRPADALRALDALADAGMATEQTDPAWLFKAFHGDVLIDVIFRSHGDLYLDDEMVARSRIVEFGGVDLRVISPEDLVVFKALVHDERSPRHWHDALAILTRCDIDWEYLEARSCHGRRRVLSLLLYGQSNDLPIPREAVSSLWRLLDEA
jgi:predicted nucleotidyltransferase